MNCPKCGYALPDDSEFCQYCGEKLSVHIEDYDAVGEPTMELTAATEAQQSEIECTQASYKESSFPSQEESDTITQVVTSQNHNEEETANVSGQKQTKSEAPIDNRKKKFCKYCGGLIDFKTKECTSCGKRYFRLSKNTVAMALLIIVLLSLVGLNAFQYIRNTAAISDLEQQIKTKSTTISSLRTTVAAQKREITKLKEKADDYDDMCTLMGTGNIGYAAYNFNASDSIIVLNKTDKSRTFTLTAYWSSGGYVSLAYSSYAATVSFDSDSWNYYTTMTVEPRYVGATVVTFSNSVDSNSFRILIIVTD